MKMWKNFQKETIQILKYYLEISQPTKSCSRLLNRIINSDTHILNKFNITIKDIDNDYIWILYYLVYFNYITKAHKSPVTNATLPFKLNKSCIFSPYKRL